MRPKVQNVSNAISVLKNTLRERYSIPSDLANQTTFFMRADRMFYELTEILEKFESALRDQENRIKILHYQLEEFKNGTHQNHESGLSQAIHSGSGDASDSEGLDL